MSLIWLYACVHSHRGKSLGAAVRGLSNLSPYSFHHKASWSPTTFSTDLPLACGFCQVSWTVCPALILKTNLLHQGVCWRESNKPLQHLLQTISHWRHLFFPSKKGMLQMYFPLLTPQPLLVNCFLSISGISWCWCKGPTTFLKVIWPPSKMCKFFS